jgi:hypothetical protein
MILELRDGFLSPEYLSYLIRFLELGRGSKSVYLQVFTDHAHGVRLDIIPNEERVNEDSTIGSTIVDESLDLAPSTGVVPKTVQVPVTFKEVEDHKIEDIRTYQREPHLT